MDQTYMKKQPVLKLILSMALPMVISMMVSSLYNIVDSFFIAKISEDAMTALSLVYPVQNLINAVMIGFGIGINAVISFYLGAQNKKMADRAATQGMLLGTIHGIGFMILGIAITEIFPGAFATLFNAGQSREYFIGAMRIISISFLFAGINVAYQGIYQALDGGVESLVISLLRQLIIILPLAEILSVFVKNGQMGVSLIWWAFPITEVISCLVGYVFLKRIRKNKVDVLN